MFSNLNNEVKTVRGVKETEFGDKIGKNEFYQGIVLLASVAALVGCACLRGCQEIQKKISKASLQQNVVNRQNCR